MEGTYIIDGSINVPNKVTLTGTSASTIIKLKNSINANINAVTNSNIATGSDIAITNITFDGNKTNNSSGAQYAIYLDGMGTGTSNGRPGATINTVRTTSFRNAGVYLTNSSSNSITNSSFKNGSTGVYLIASSNNNTISGNTMDANSDNMIFNASNYNKVDGNIISYGAGNNVYTTASAYNNFSNNIVISSGSNGFQITSSTHSIFADNTINSNGSEGISLASSSNFNTISGNKLHDNGGANNNNSISLSNSDSNLITSNNTTDTSCTTTCYAIYIVNAGSDTNYLANNTLGTGSINDAGTGTIYGGQTNSAGNYLIQPAGTIALMKNTNVTGALTVTTTISTGSTPTVRVAADGQLQNVYITPNSTVKVGTSRGILFTDTAGTLSLLTPGSANECLSNDGTNFVWAGCSGSGGGTDAYKNGGANLTTNIASACGTTATTRIATSFDTNIVNPTIGLCANSDLDLTTNNISRINVAANGDIKVLSNSGNSTEKFVVRTQYTGSPAQHFNTLRVDTSSDTLGRVGIGLLYGTAPDVRLDIGGNATSTGSTTNGGLQVRASTAPGVSMNASNGGGAQSSGRIYFDELTGKFKVSENGGAYVNLIQTTSSSPFELAGNTVSSQATLGTLNGFALRVVTNNVERLAFDTSGNITFKSSSFVDFNDASNLNTLLRVDRFNSSVLINTTSAMGGAALNVGGMINATGYKVGGTDGATLSCGAGNQALSSFSFVGGILVSGACATNNSDLAEAYNSTDSIEPGELVMAAGSFATSVSRATASGEHKLMGIVSTDPAQTIGTSQVPNGYPIALSGRVPTKVNGEGGPISIGDKITISSVDGIGKKATTAGMIVGTAVETFDGVGTGTIEVFVNLSYYEPSDTSVLQGGAATFASLQVSGQATLTNLTVTGTTSVQNIIIGGHIITSSGQPTVEVRSESGIDASAAIEGNDTAGTIVITTGDTTAIGSLAKIIFSERYNKSPKIVLSPSSDTAAALNYYKGDTTDESFMFNVTNLPSSNTTYKFDYFISE